MHYTNSIPRHMDFLWQKRYILSKIKMRTFLKFNCVLKTEYALHAYPTHFASPQNKQQISREWHKFLNSNVKNLDVKMCGIRVIFFLYSVRNHSGYGWSVCAEPHFPISRLSRFHTESLIMTPFVIACAKRSIKGLLSCSHTLFKKVLYISPCSRFVLKLCRTW